MLFALSFALQRQTDVGPKIRLRKCPASRQRRQPANMDIAHPERNDAHPRAAVEEIEVQLGWDKRPHLLRLQCPMREQQIMPALKHDPGTLRQWPGTMCGSGKNVVNQCIIYLFSSPSTENMLIVKFRSCLENRFR